MLEGKYFYLDSGDGFFRIGQLQEKIGVGTVRSTLAHDDQLRHMT